MGVLAMLGSIVLGRVVAGMNARALRKTAATGLPG